MECLQSFSSSVFVRFPLSRAKNGITRALFLSLHLVETILLASFSTVITVFHLLLRYKKWWQFLFSQDQLLSLTNKQDYGLCMFVISILFVFRTHCFFVFFPINKCDFPIRDLYILLNCKWMYFRANWNFGYKLNTFLDHKLVACSCIRSCNIYQNKIWIHFFRKAMDMVWPCVSGLWNLYNLVFWI